MSAINRTRIILGVGLVFLISACGLPFDVPVALLVSTSTPTQTSTAVPSATPTPTFTATPIPSPTATVVPTVTPTPRPPIIDSSNVAQIRQIASWKSPNDSWIKQVVWSPGGKTLATLENQQAVLWEVATGDVRWIITGPDHSLSISPDGRMLAAGIDNSIVKIWDASTGYELKDLGRQSSPVNAVPFSPDSRFLFTGSTYGVQKFWDVATGHAVGDLDNMVNGVVVSAAFSPDGKIIAVGTGSSRGGGIELWDATTFEEVGSFFDGRDDKYSVAFSPDGKLLASGSLFGNIKLWDIANQREVSTFQVKSSIDSVAFSPKGDLLAATNRNGIDLLQVPALRELRLLTGHTGAVKTVAFSPDGKFLASGSQDGTIILWGIQP